MVLISLVMAMIYKKSAIRIDDVELNMCDDWIARTTPEQHLKQTPSTGNKTGMLNMLFNIYELHISIA